MKVLQLGKYYAPMRGGIETVTRRLAEGLAAAGDGSYVLCSDSPGSDAGPGPAPGVVLRRLPTLGEAFSQPLNPAFASELRELVNGGRGIAPDLLHLHSPNPQAELAVLRLKSRLPLVVSYHADIQRQRRLLPLYAPLLRAVLERADRIVVGSQALLGSSPFLEPFRSKCRVVPFGIDAEAFSASVDAARVGELRRLHGDFVLFVGRLVPYKGVDRLLEAAARIGCRAVIIGDGPLGPELRRQAQALGLSGSVSFLGDVPEHALPSYYGACRALALPSRDRSEAFGLVLLEAMACSRPVVATRLGTGVDEVVEDGVSGLLVERGDADALAPALEALLRAPELAEKLGRAARERVLSRYRLDAMIGAYRLVYRELAERGGILTLSAPSDPAL